MKLSIRMKLVLALMAILALYVIITFTLNTAFLKVYYKTIKKETLILSYGQLVSYDFNDRENTELLIEQLEEMRGIQVYVIDGDMQVYYCNRSSRDAMRSITLSDGDMGMWFAPWVVQQFYDDGPVGGPIHDVPDLSIFSAEPLMAERTSRRLSLTYISLYAKHSDAATGKDYYVVINTPLAAIDESILINNRFALFAMLAILAVGTLITSFVSDKMVSPFRKMSVTTKKMANLDFSDRLPVVTDDEVGQLAQSINYMSEQLETKINELRIANEQLMRDIEEKERLNQMKTELISNVSHELKTPLSIIIGYSEGLQLGVNSEERDYYCSIIQDEAEKMSLLASRLLDIAELESGGTPLELTGFDLAQLAEDRAQKLGFLLSESERAIGFESSGNCMVTADRGRIEEVINNLLSNAMNHTPEQGTIKVTVTEKVDEVEVVVYNSGSHIPEDSLDKIWESFYKVDKARTRKYGGSGLGLKIVSTVLQSHTHAGCRASCGARNLEDGVEVYFTLAKSREVEVTESE